MKMNEWEQTFKGVVEEASHYVSGDGELEVMHHNGGWYACEYKNGQAMPIYKNEYDKKPLISDDTAKEHGVRVRKVLSQMDVYYSEC